MPETTPVRRRYSWLEPALAPEGAVILTANRRLARELRDAYNQQQVDAGRSAWPTPPVHFFRDWVKRQFDQYESADNRQVLQGSAAALIWERCVRRHASETVLGATALARLAASTWRIVSDWRIPLESVVRSARTQDERLFAAAADDYRRALQQGGWIDEAGVADRVAELLRSGGIEQSGPATLVGFDRVPPVVEALIDALRARATAVTVRGPTQRGSRRVSTSFVDEAAELRAAGAWAADTLRQDPERDVAIVVSELERDAQRVLRLVREGFAPGWQVGGDAYLAAVDISYGRPLSDYPAISMALLCLRLVTEGIESDAAGRLLMSAFFQHGGTPIRARFEQQLRVLPIRTWLPEDLAACLRPAGDEGSCDDAEYESLQLLDALIERRTEPHERRSPSSWAKHIDDLLQTCGWPGGGTLNSLDFQLIDRWRELLNELARLDNVSGQVSFGDAVQRLSSLAAEALFRPEIPGACVRILGPLETAGMEFDAVWMGRCDAERWPGSSQPSPLLNRSLQREFGVPDAQPADSLAHSTRVLTRIAASAPRVVLSWARSVDDSPRAMSPLLAGLDCTEESPANDPGWYANSLAGSATLEASVDDPVPAVGDDETVIGGAGTLRLQETEPFQAFARGRLGVRDLERFPTGLTPAMRGNLLHDALESLYRDRPSQAEIASWTSDERVWRIRSATDRSIASMRRCADDVLNRLLDIERQRMRSLLQTVIEHDLQRQPFEIAMVEERLEFSRSGVSLRLRADRIDRLPDGSVIIIDYKTGRGRNLLTRDGDPLDPQVPVYAAAMPADTRIGALAVMNVNATEVSLRAAGVANEAAPMSDGDWHELLARWTRDVEAGIDSFAKGDVSVNLSLHTKRPWQLNVLCRAQELLHDD